MTFEALSTRSVKITDFTDFDMQLAARCQLYIKALSSYSLKMASRQPKHFSCYVSLIKYILYNKGALDYKLTYLTFVRPCVIDINDINTN